MFDINGLIYVLQFYLVSLSLWLDGSNEGILFHHHKHD
jgi:hypothetical protein